MFAAVLARVSLYGMHSVTLTQLASSERRSAMLYWAVVLFVIALIAAFLGFGGIAASAAGMAKVLFFVFLVLAVVALIFGRRIPT